MLPTFLADERTAAHVRYIAHSKSEPFEMAVTKQGVVLLRKKRFAMSNPYYLQQIPLDEMRSIRVTRLSALPWWALAVLLIIAGAYTTWGMFTEAYRNNGGTVSGWPIAMFVGGLLLPFAARRRYALIVEARNSSFQWKPAFILGEKGRQYQNQLMSTIVNGARQVGIVVQDERGAA